MKNHRIDVAPMALELYNSKSDANNVLNMKKVVKC